MHNIFDKKDFYNLMLRERLPIARASFAIERRRGVVDLFSTPLGVVLRADVGVGIALKEIKIYDRKRGDFFIQNVFCGENLIKLDEGVFVGVSSRVQIEDVIDREILIKVEGAGIVARVEMMPKREREVDKFAHLVYN